MPQGVQDYIASSKASAAQYGRNEDAQRAHRIGDMQATLEILAMKFPEVDEYLARLART